MEKVSVIDIQGEQWAIKDQEATERLNKLEEKTNIKKTLLWENPGSFFELVEINGVKYYNAIFEGVPFVREFGQTIFTIQNVGQIYPINRAIVMAEKVDKSGRVPVSIDIYADGTVKAYAIFNDMFNGKHTDIRIYGQIFQMVN